MGAAEPAQLDVYFELLGRSAGGVKAYEINSSFITPTDGFGFTLYDTDPRKLQGLELQPVAISLNGNPQALGRIEATEGDDADGTALRCEGRDYLAELIECHLDWTVTLKSGMTLEAAIKLAGAPVGISTVLGDDEVRLADIRSGITIGGRRKDKLKAFLEAKLEDYKAEPGEGIFEFLNKICVHHGCLMQPGRKRSEIVLAEPNYTAPVVAELVRLRDPPSSGANTIETSRCRRDCGQFPSFVMLTGRSAKPDEGGSSMRFETGLQLGSDVFEPHINEKFVVNRRLKPSEGPKTELGLYRLFYRRDTDARTQEQLAKAALRAISERLRPMLQYECTVRGHIVPDTTSALWAADMMIKVRDEVRFVDEVLWVEQVTFRYDETNGPTTTIGCVRPGTFVL